jgi:hypothetical protein
MEQQTAVEYLVNQLFPKALSEEQYYHIQKAKEMEKERMIEFGCLLTFESKHIIEEDYNEIYGGNK